MPSKKQYNLVSDDAYDCRIPLYNEEAFQHGITFHAKYIGSLDVPRPTSRVEIVAAMRRIRYEFKAKSVKKQKVSLTVSVEGVKVAIRDKKKSNQWPWDENKFVLMQHPIYRIFYVSHDSQDLKIFSYIARDGGTNSFKCSVFKSKKKNQAMRIVRTVGQAFEVCHKLSLALASSSACGLQDELECNQLPDASQKGDGASEPNSCDTQIEDSPSSKIHETLSTPQSPRVVNGGSDARKLQNEVPKHCHTNDGAAISDGKSLDVRHDIQYLKDQLEQQNQKIITVSSQVQILKDQLSNETSARHQIQVQNEQLLVSNRQLFEQMSRLAQRFNTLEHRCYDSTSRTRMDAESLQSPQGISSLNGTDFPTSFSNHEGIRRNNSEAAYDNIDQGKSPFMKLESNSDFGISNSSFGRQLSSSSVTFPLSSMTSNSRGSNTIPSNASLPGTPLTRNFPLDAGHYFKYPSPQNSCLKQTKSSGKVPSALTNNSLPGLEDEAKMPLESRSSYELPSTKGIHNKHAENSSYSYNSSPLFRREKAKPHFPPTTQDSGDSIFSRSSPMTEEDWSSHPPSKSESFIAQVTRDLAKMNSSNSDTEATHPSSYSGNQYASLFKKS